MGRFFKLVGALLLVAVLGIGGLVGYAVYQGNAYDAESKAYVEASVPAIVSGWSEQELLKRASPQLLDELHKHPGQLDRVFHRMSALGALKRLGKVHGESYISFDLTQGRSTTAAYEVKAVFANGSADIKMRLIRQAGKWEFLNFYVTAPDFLKPQPRVQTV